MWLLYTPLPLHTILIHTSILYIHIFTQYNSYYIYTYIYTFHMLRYIILYLHCICVYTYTAFHFFADVALQRYYKRFVRDYIRYKDEIFCIADDIITAIRKDVRKTEKGHNSDAVFGSGNYYALHIR